MFLTPLNLCSFNYLEVHAELQRSADDVVKAVGIVSFEPYYDGVFVFFLINCIVSSIKNRAYMGASCLFVCMLTNLGEFTFFSMSYTGGFVWAMVFVGLALDIRKMQDENDEIMRQMMMGEMGMNQMPGRVQYWR